MSERWPGSLQALLPALAALAEAEPEREVCGFVLEDPGGGVALRPARNAAVDPSRRFDIHPDDLFAVHRHARDHGSRTAAVYHSHPKGGAGLSATDRVELLLDDGSALLPGVDLLVVGLRLGRVEEVRLHRWSAPGGFTEVARATPERTAREEWGWVISAKPPGSRL